MKYRTKTFKFGTTIVLVSFINIVVSMFQVVSSQQYFSLNILDFEKYKPGLIRDTLVDDGVLLIGAENGLFRVVGEQIEVFDSSNSEFDSGFISSIDRGNDGRVWVTIYGCGVFEFVKKSNTLKRVTLPQEFSKRAWSSASSSGLLFVNLINSILIYDLSSSKVTGVLEQTNNELFHNIYSIDVNENGNVWFAERNRILKYNVKTDELVPYLSIEEFPELSTFTYVAQIDKTLYIGGMGTLLAVSEDERTEIIAIKNNNNEVEDVHIDSTGKLWLAAGGLFNLSEDGQLINEATNFYPLLNESRIKTVTSISETPQGEIIASSTQSGLLVFDGRFDGVTYFNRDDYLFIDTIETVIGSSNSNLVFSKEGGVYELDTRTASLSKLKNVENIQENKIVKIGRYSFVNSEKCSLFSYFGSRFTELDSVLDKKICEGMTNIFSISSENSSWVKFDFNSYSSLKLISSSGEVLDEKKIPQHVESILRANNGSLVLKGKNNLFFIENGNGAWIQKELKEVNNQSISCLYERNDKRFAICLSGSGIINIDQHSFEMVKEPHPLNNRTRFVRAGFADSLGNEWLSTNNGFFLLDEGGNLTHLNRNYGIVDSDFEYGGIIPIDENNLIVVGDQYNYLIDAAQFTSKTKAMLNRVSTSKVDEISIDLTNWIDGKHSEEVSNPSSQANNRYQIPFLFKSIRFNFSSTDFSQASRQQIEYRMLGYKDEWRRLSSSYGEVEYDALPSGELTFQVRVVDKRSKATQPVTSVFIRVLPPFWRTWQANILYVLLSVILFWMVRRWVKAKVADKNMELSNIVQQQQDALKASDSSIKQLLEQKQILFTNLSHELRTPLTLISAPIEQLRKNPNDTENSERINLVYRNTKQLQLLVDQLMEIEQLDRIKEIPKRGYDIKETVSVVLDNIRPLALNKQLKLNSKIDDIGVFYLLQDTLDKVLYNLLINAIKYTPEKGLVSISIGLEQKQIKIIVSDSGSGIAETEQDLVFERFSRLTEHNQIQGSGIGLALVKELVLANAGWIELNNNEPVGSKFTVSLPANEASDDEKTESATKYDLSIFAVDRSVSEFEPSLPISENGANKPVLLIVEDTDDLRHFLFSAFKDDYVCYVARNGEDGFSIAEKVVPDIVLTDLLMPICTGEELAMKIRKHPLLSSTPIIMLSAKGDTNTRLSSLQIQIDDFVAKPFELEELMLRVRNILLNRSRAAKQLKASLTVEKVNSEAAHFNDEKEQVFYLRFMDVLEQNFSQESFTRANAAEQLAVSERQLNRKLETLIEGNFVSFLRQFRLQKAKSMLEQGVQVSQVAYDVGFSSPSYFSNCFKQEYGCTPKEYITGLKH